MLSFELQFSLSLKNCKFRIVFQAWNVIFVTKLDKMNCPWLFLEIELQFYHIFLYMSKKTWTHSRNYIYIRALYDGSFAKKQLFWWKDRNECLKSPFLKLPLSHFGHKISVIYFKVDKNYNSQEKLIVDCVIKWLTKTSSESVKRVTAFVENLALL